MLVGGVGTIASSTLTLSAVTGSRRDRNQIAVATATPITATRISPAVASLGKAARGRAEYARGRQRQQPREHHLADDIPVHAASGAAADATTDDRSGRYLGGG